VKTVNVSDLLEVLAARFNISVQSQLMVCSLRVFIRLVDGFSFFISLIWSALFGLIGLFVTLPVLGHAMWYLYRQAVKPAETV
tara:strand:+ start:7280 stop:7528 length:249 start_codon:yes stop_codon:yes gene_type:complete